MIYLHEILNTMMTARSARPRPQGANSKEMIPIPVRVAVYANPDDDSPAFYLDAEAFTFHPYSPRVVNDDTGEEVKPEQQAEFLIRVTSSPTKGERHA